MKSVIEILLHLKYNSPATNNLSVTRLFVHLFIELSGYFFRGTKKNNALKSNMLNELTMELIATWR